MTSTLVVIPTFNEIESLPGVVERLLSSTDVSCLVVDDASPDGTGEWVDRHLSDRVQVLHRPAKSGLATAYVDGFRWGIEHGFDQLVEMDADGSHQPEHVNRLVARAAGPDRPDLVIGSRWIPGGSVPGWSKARVALSQAGNKYIRIMLGMPIHDATAGFRLYRADFLVTHAILEQVDSTGFTFQVDMTQRVWDAGATIVEVPITFTQRQFGESKLSSSIFTEELSMVTKRGLGRLAQKIQRSHS